MGSNTIIGIPEREGDFERNCRILFSELINDPNAKVVATRGKNQGGFDIIGTRDRDPGKLVGIQCKNKPKGGNLDMAGVRSDVTRMLGFSPPVTEIFIVTTAANDLEHDKLALEIRQEQQRLGRTVDIQIWGWDTLTDHIQGSAAALRAFDPDRSASTGEILRQGAESLDLHHEQIATQKDVIAKLEGMATQLQQMVPPIDTSSDDAVDAVLDKQLDGIRDLLNSGSARSALTLLDALQSQSAGRSAAIRSRILGNMGFAHLRLGNERRGGELLIEAYSVNPRDPKARANHVLGLTLTGDVNGAIVFGRASLEEHPDNAAVAAFVYQAAAMADEDLAPDSIVPAEMWGDENVGITRTGYLRRHAGPTAWRAWAIARSQAHPHSSVLRRFGAEAVLDELYERRAFGPGDAQGDDRQLMLKAAADLRALWDVERDHEDAVHAGAIAIANNLITAYRALRDVDAADEVGRQALTIAPDDADLNIAVAHIDSIRGRPDLALAKLSGLPDSPARTMPLLAAYANLQRWDEMIELTTPARAAGLTGLDRQAFDCMALHARLETRVVEDPGSALDGLAASWPTELHVIATAADLAHQYAPERFDALFAMAMAVARGTVPMAERLVLAELAIRINHFDEAIEALDGHVGVDAVSEPLAWLALSFANAATRPRTHAFFESLPAAVLENGRIARLAGAAEYTRGDLGSAERHLRQAIRADPRDLRAHLMLQGTLKRDGRADQAAALARGIDETVVQGSALDKMRLAVALRRAGEAERALALGFEIAIANRDNEDISAAYPQLIFLSEQPLRRLHPGGGAREDFWCDLEGIGCADVAGVVTATPIPNVLNFVPDHTVALAIYGKMVGDEVVLPPSLGIERRYRLRELKHKWVWLSHQILHDHGARFPGSSGFVEMTMEDGDVCPVLEIVRRSEDQARQIMDTYQSTAMPLAIMATLHHGDVVGLARRIAASGGSIKTCVGLHAERSRAERVVRRASGKGGVLDTYTLVTAHGLDMLPDLQAHFGRLVVARSTVDEIVEWRERQAANADRETMQLSYEGEQAVRHVQSPADNAGQLTALESLLEAVRTHCEVRTADGHPNVLDGQHFDAAGIGEVLDPIRIAHRDKLLLLSEDMHYRQLAEMGGVTAHAWLQAAALVLKAARRISVFDYATLVARLAFQRHDFVTVDSDTLLLLFGREGDDDDQAFNVAARSIGGPKADLASHAGVVIGFACGVWSSPVASWRKGRAISRLLDNLIKGRGAHAVGIIAAVEARLRNTRPSITDRSDLAREHVAGWRQGHFLDSRAHDRAPRGRKPRR